MWMCTACRKRTAFPQRFTGHTCSGSAISGWTATAMLMDPLFERIAALISQRSDAPVERESSSGSSGPSSTPVKIEAHAASVTDVRLDGREAPLTFYATNTMPAGRTTTTSAADVSKKVLRAECPNARKPSHNHWDSLHLPCGRASTPFASAR